MPARHLTSRVHFVRALIATAALTAPLPSAAHAQVDIESLRSGDVPEGISGQLGGALAVKTGNTELVDLSFNGRLNWVRGPANTLLIADGGLGALRGDRFSSSGLLHLRQTHWLAERIAVEGFGQLNYDRPLLLDFRALAGAGLRVRLTSGEWGSIGGGSSFMLEREDFRLPVDAAHPDRTETVRNSTFLTLRLVGGERFVVSSTAYFQPALSALADDVRVIENLRLSATLTERLGLTVSFDLRYDSGPPDGIAALDTHLRTGVTVTF